MPKTATSAKTIDQYLEAVPSGQRDALKKLRRTIKSVVPKAEECISYQLPAFRLDGRPLVAFGASREHCALYLMSDKTVAAHAKDLEGYDTSKGTVRFPANRPLPVALVRKLVKARIAENQEKTAAFPRKTTVKKPKRGKKGDGRIDPAVTAFIDKIKHPLRTEIEALRQLILGASPAVREGIKWNAPSFRTDDYFATMNFRGRDSMRLILHNGAKVKRTAKVGIKIKDPAGLLEWLAKDRCMITLKGRGSVADRRTALRNIIREWVRKL